MGFKTYTCCICGKEGLTKPQSYAIEGKGRACREHQEAKDAFTERDNKIKAKQLAEHIEFRLKEATRQEREEKLELMQQALVCMKKEHFTIDPDWSDYKTLEEIQIFCSRYSLLKSTMCFKSLSDKLGAFSLETKPWTKLMYKTFLDKISTVILKGDEKTRCIDICGNDDMQAVLDAMNEIVGQALAVFDFKEVSDIKNTCRRFSDCIFKDMVDSMEILRLHEENWTEKMSESFVNIHDRMKRFEELLNYYRENNVLTSAVGENYFALWTDFQAPYSVMLAELNAGNLEGELAWRLLDCITKAKEAILKMRKLEE